MSVFSLEALDARYGDCLVVHAGDRRQPQTLLIDGGPPRSFQILGPRLDELRSSYWGDRPLPVALVVATHIDNDHLCGLIELAEAMIEGPFGPQLVVEGIWHNTFERSVEAGLMAEPVDDDLVLAATFADPVREAAGVDAVVAGVVEGDRLARLARDLGWRRNTGFQDLVRADAPGAEQSIGNLRIRVVLPDEARLRDLARKYREASATATPDESIANLASVVLLLERDGRRMLLTGDARGDHVLDGLEAAGAFGGKDRLPVDILKLPHHGSDRNVISDEFFNRLPARHYVISADGRHGNPDVATLERLVSVRSDDEFAIHMTYAPERLRQPAADLVGAFFDQQRASGRRFSLSVRPTDSPSLVIDLGEPIGA